MSPVLDTRLAALRSKYTVAHDHEDDVIAWSDSTSSLSRDTASHFMAAKAPTDASGSPPSHFPLPPLTPRAHVSSPPHTPQSHPTTSRPQLTAPTPSTPW